MSVYCRCGAQWHGRYATNNYVIALHRTNSDGLHKACLIVSHTEFIDLYRHRCHCTACQSKRSQGWYKARRRKKQANRIKNHKDYLTRKGKR